MKLNFGLLGPVRAHTDGTEIPLGPLKQRTLLAALLLRPNSIVPLHQLVAALWEGTPPPSAVANLRTYVHRLRRTISSATGVPDRILLRHPGYGVCVRPGELDVSEFAEHQRHGRRSLLNGDPTTAVSSLGTALDLWRGAAAEDLPRTTELTPRLEALDEQRRDAIEDLMRARLALGLDTELVYELRALVAESPTREGLWSSLMLALYRSGDAAAALDTYRAARHALGEHLGIAPGAELVQLQNRVLNRDPSLHVHCRTETTRSLLRATPSRTLPAEPTTFVGRKAELAVLRRALRPGREPVAAAVHGGAGSGTSFLAAKAAASLADHYPDGQLHVDLRGPDGITPRTPEDALARMLRDLGLSQQEVPNGIDERSQRLRELVGGRRVLVFVDNVTDESQVRPLMVTWPGAATLIAGRSAGRAFAGVRHVDLGPLSCSEGLELLGALCGAERVDAEPGAARRIVRLCDHQPSPLWIAGVRLSTRREWTLATFADLLSDQEHRLDELRCGDRSFRTALDIGYLALRDSARPTDRRAAALFRELGRARPEEFGAALSASLLNCGVAAATAALGRLADVRLIEPVHHDRYRLTGLLLAYAIERAAVPGAIMTGGPTGEDGDSVAGVSCDYTGVTVGSEGPSLRDTVPRSRSAKT